MLLESGKVDEIAQESEGWHLIADFSSASVAASLIRSQRSLPAISSVAAGTALARRRRDRDRRHNRRPRRPKLSG
jgi:hypothetical protein